MRGCRCLESWSNCLVLVMTAVVVLWLWMCLRLWPMWGVVNVFVAVCLRLLHCRLSGSLGIGWSSLPTAA